MVARPPTSAVVGRNVTPARRADAVLLMLAASTRALRPTVLTAAFNFSRTLWPVAVLPAARDDATDRADDVPALAVVPRVDVDVEMVRDGVTDAPDAAATVVDATLADVDTVVGTTAERDTTPDSERVDGTPRAAVVVAARPVTDDVDDDGVAASDATSPDFTADGKIRETVTVSSATPGPMPSKTNNRVHKTRFITMIIIPYMPPKKKTKVSSPNNYL